MKLFYNAEFYSMENEADSPKAVLADGSGVIKKVFYETDSINIENAERIDLGGAYVFPGFIDTHTHSFSGGLYSRACDLSGVRSLTEVFELLKDTEPICGRIMAWQFDENKVREKRFPSVEELDMLFPDRPVYVRRVDGHSSALNSYALKKIGSIKPVNGIISGNDIITVSVWFHDVDDETVYMAYKSASEIALRAGITTVHTMVNSSQADDFFTKYYPSFINKLPVEFIPYPQTFDIKKVLGYGTRRIGGCILADGSFGSMTAALLKPYTRKTKGKSYKGRLYHTDQFWNSFAEEAHKYNLQIAVHAIGDAAVTQILNAYEKVQKANPKDLRHQIIHCELVSDKILDRMENLSISIPAQPMFDKLWGGEVGLYSSVIGKQRALSCNRFRSIKSKNILLTGGSDWYITNLDVLAGIDAAVNMHNRNERLSKYEALEIYTREAAKLSFDEQRLGKIKKGMSADMVCLDNNPLTSSEIKNIKVKMVIKNGCIVYDSQLRC